MDGVKLEYLSRYRDEVLQRSGFGRLMIRIYYKLSRGLAPLAGKSGLVRGLIRVFFYRPAAAWAISRVNRKAYKNYRKNRRTKKAVRAALARMEEKGKGARG